MKNIITSSSAETRRLGYRLAKKLKGGEIIALIGDLGSGKTVFTQGLAQGLNVRSRVTSPTFTLLKLHKAGLPKKKIRELCHIDAYRITAGDLSAIGLEDYLGRKDVVTVIEWADRVKKLLPRSVIKITLKIKDQNKRELIIGGLEIIS